VTWLGNGSDEWQKQTSDAAIQTWQGWVVATLEELHTLSLSSGVFRWEPFFASLAACLQERGAYTNVARMTGMRREVLYRWKEATYTPSLEAIFKLCYVFDVTPVQIMNNQTTKVKQALESATGVRVPQFRRHHRRVDLERCQAYLQAVLDGCENPLCFRQITQHLGYAERQLYYHFPRECALIAPLMREYRKLRQEERLNQIREQVRQAAMALHAQGIYPSQRQLRPLLPGGLMRLQAAKEAWLATLHKLGFEPRNVRHTHVGAAPAL
jgi:DNA-binding phage protein